jgi:hypothetical protein
LNWNSWVRQIHRWLFIAFTVAGIVNIIALVREEQAIWVGLLPLLPLAVLVRVAVCRDVAQRAKRQRASSIVR